MYIPLQPTRVYCVSSDEAVNALAAHGRCSPMQVTPHPHVFCELSDDDSAALHCSARFLGTGTRDDDVLRVNNVNAEDVPCQGTQVFVGGWHLKSYAA